MRIAMLAPPWYSVPPRGYGGIESLVAGLVDGLHDRGHEVLLIHAGLNGTRAPGVATLPEPASQGLGDETLGLLHILKAEEIIADFSPDVVHDHTVIGPSMARRRGCPTVTTVHGRVAGAYGELLGRQRSVFLVAISDAHRASAPQLPWFATVRNGIPVSSFPYRADKNDDLVFLGRMDPDKGVVQAIDIAERTGRHLRIAARLLGPDEEDYFASAVRPRLSDRIEYVGELDFAAKTALLAESRAFLFPLQWEEPYGLVVAEAQACGTPVLSLRRGAIPELVIEGRTGILRDDASELDAAVDDVHRLGPAHCRSHAESQLDISQTVLGYERVYADAVRRTAKRTSVITVGAPRASVSGSAQLTEGVMAVTAPTPTTETTRRTR